jgi:UDP-2,4-diacetamido-2,4,6-trideoxy-beta-L-altropyranose hydrolase
MPHVIDVRPALDEDCHDLWLWRNDPHTRAMSISMHEVDWVTHQGWFRRVLADPHRTILIGMVGEDKIGMCRFDSLSTSPPRVETSINLNPGYRGRRLAVPLLRASICAYRARSDDEIVAQVRDENMASIRTFERSGFWLAWRFEGLRFYRYAEPSPNGLMTRFSDCEVTQ